MAGVLHNPESDIKIIADNLRDRYKSGFPVLKEIIQNADDAGASELVIGWSEGLIGAEHPLLNDPAVFFINNGTLTSEDVKGILSIALGAKTENKSAVGKFGLGMKSLFHLGEVFFFMANDWRDLSEKCEVFNPWADRRSTWESFSNSDRDLLERTLHGLTSTFNGSKHFIVWVPLRSQSIMNLRGDAPGVIIKSHDYGKEIPDFLIEPFLSSKIANLFPMLKHLEVVKLSAIRSGAESELFSVTTQEGAEKIAFGRDNRSSGLDDSGDQSWVGRVEIDQPPPLEPMVIDYAASEVLLKGVPFTTLKNHSLWPTSYGRGQDEVEKQIPDKAEPHAAAVFMRKPSIGVPELTVQWAVFLPLGEQDIAQSSQRYQKALSGKDSYDIMLHGYFFIDAGRVGIHGQRDIGKNNGRELASEEDITLEWNRQLANHGTLNCIIPALSALIERCRLNQAEIESISRGIKNFIERREDLPDIHPWITCNYQWIYRVQRTGKGWVKLDGEVAVRYLPPPVGNPSLEDYERVWATFPALRELDGDVAFAEQSHPNLAAKKRSEWTITELRKMLSVNITEVFSNRQYLGYMNDFLTMVFEYSPDMRSQLQDELIGLSRKALATLGLENLSKIKKPLQKYVGFIHPNSRYRIRIDRDERFVWQGLSVVDCGLLLVPDFADADSSPANGSLTFDNTKKLLEAIAEIPAENVDSLVSVEKVVSDILSRLSNIDRGEIYKSCGHLSLFPARDACDKRDKLVSRNALYQLHQDRLLFTFSGPGNVGLGRPLREALTAQEVLFIKDSISKQLFDGRVQKCEAESVLKLLAGQPELNDASRREKILRKLAGTDLLEPEQINAMRYLLHATRGADTRCKLWISADDGGIWSRVRRAAFSSQETEWTVLPNNLALHVTTQHKGKMNLHEVQPEKLVEELGDSLVDLDYTKIVASQSDAEQILERINQKEIWCQLPLHTSLEEKRVAVNSLSVLAGQIELPVELGKNIISIVPARSKVVRSQQREWIGELDERKVLEIALNKEEPAKYSDLILEKLQRLDNQLDEALTELLKNRKWLTVGGSPVAPCTVVKIDGNDFPEAKKLCLRDVSCYLIDQLDGISQSSSSILEPFLILPENSLTILIENASRLPEYAIGQCSELSEKAILQATQHRESFSSMPGWQLILESFDASRFSLTENSVLAKLYKDPTNEATLVQVHQSLGHPHPIAATDHIRASLLRAVCSLPDPARHLETMRLRACDDQYRPSKQLAYGVVGLEPKHLLHKKEWEVLSSVLEQGREEIEESQRLEPTNSTMVETAGVLRTYFSEWKHYVPEECIAPVLVLMSGDRSIEDLADSLLGQSSVAGLLQKIGKKWEVKKDYPARPVFFPNMTLEQVVADMHFTVELLVEKALVVDSIFGKKIKVEIACNPDNIFVWEYTEYTYKHGITLKIVPINLKNISERQTINILKNSAELLLEKVYHQAINLDEIWSSLSDVEQLDIAVARAIIMDSIVHHLKELKIRRPPIGELLTDFRKDLQRTKEAEHNNQVFDSSSTEILYKIRLHIETDEYIQNALLAAMRTKMEEYQYRVASVPFEIFQNADDAVEERREIEIALGAQPAVTRRFIVESNAGYLRFYHWGRDVNQYRTFEGEFDGRERGFDADLDKMLTLNVSDKGEETTGKFGLGFKSCLLICDRPEVYSGRLAIRIIAGILPEVSPRAEELEELVNLHRMDNRSPTLINLQIRETIDADSIVTEFGRAAGLLPIFSKNLKTILLDGVEFSWSPTECQQIKGLSFGYASLPIHDGSLRKQRVAHYQTSHSQFVFQIGSKGFTSMAERDVAKLWVLNPLWETISLGFIVEADFQIDVGRSQLARKSLDNTRLMQRLGVDLANLFGKIYQWSSHDWSDFSLAWELEDSANSDDFWRSTWRILTDGWPKRLGGAGANGEIDVGATLINELFVADGGLLSFYQNTPVLPSALNKVNPTLIALESVRYYADPLLSRIIDTLVTLPYVDELLRKRRLISDDVGGFFRSTNQLLKLDISEMTLDGIIDTIVPTKEVSPRLAAVLGKVFDANFEKRLADQKATHEQAQRFRRFLSSLQFISEQQTWTVSHKLLIGHGKGKDDDESLRSNFAPDFARLSSQYEGKGLGFFLFCRERVRIGVDDMFGWDNWKEPGGSEEMRRALCRYLIHGDNGEALAIKLNQERYMLPWLNKLDAAVLSKWGWSKPDIDKLLNFLLASEQERERRVDRQLKKDWQTQRSPDEVLNDIYEWWQDEKQVQLPLYQQKLYPGGHFPWKNILDGDTDNKVTRKAWLQLLYLGSCQTLGRSKEEQHRSALNWFEQKGWWDIFAAKGTIRPDQWLKVMDEYLDQAITNDQYRNWLQILPLYRFARNFEDYVTLFYGAEQYLDSLDDILRPGSSQQLAGTGISPPELRATLGIGTNFILRELVRNEAMEPRILSKHCYVPSRIVRSLMSKLDCSVTVEDASPHDSEKIYRFIVDNLGDDKATFGGCFDIPLRIIYENQVLRERFFGVGILDIEL